MGAFLLLSHLQLTGLASVDKIRRISGDAMSDLHAFICFGMRICVLLLKSSTKSSIARVFDDRVKLHNRSPAGGWTIMKFDNYTIIHPLSRFSVRISSFIL